MTSQQRISGFVSSGDAQIYYETAGQGQPFVMIHAGVADSRQWDDAFAFFAQQYQVVRYDLRGFGQSQPVAGEFRHIDDLRAVVGQLGLSQPAVVMGCSMGGGLAMDFTLEHPDQVAALIMVCSAPTGFEIDMEPPALFKTIGAAYDAGDLDLATELETQLWFDGLGRSPEQVNPQARALAYAMNRNDLELDARHLGKRLPDIEPPAVTRLAELTLPVLVVIGLEDLDYMQVAADTMIEQIATARKAPIADAAHLPNMEHPEQFRSIVADFLASL